MPGCSPRRSWRSPTRTSPSGVEALSRQADGVGSRGTEGRCLRTAAARRFLPARPSASSAAASSAACWRWPPRASASRRHIYCDRQRPGLRRGNAHHQGRFRRPRGTVRASRQRSTRSPTSSRTCRRHRRHLAGAGAGAAGRQGAGGGAGPPRRRSSSSPRLGIPVAPFRAIDGRSRPGRRLAAARRAGHPENAPPGLRRQGPGAHRTGDDAAAAWAEIGGAPAVLEGRIHFTLELSALVVRGLDGETAFYDCPLNTHENGILRRVGGPVAACRRRPGARPATLPAPLPRRSTMSACWRWRCSISAPMRAGRALMVNEIAPRVHNSGHWTIEACAIEPVREPHPRRGRLAARLDAAPQRRRDGQPDRRGGARLAAPGGRARRRLHLYGKREARPGRKMGHVTRLLPLGVPLIGP